MQDRNWIINKIYCVIIVSILFGFSNGSGALSVEFYAWGRKLVLVSRVQSFEMEEYLEKCIIQPYTPELEPLRFEYKAILQFISPGNMETQASENTEGILLGYILFCSVNWMDSHAKFYGE